jgi:hypothetical protein
MTEVLTFDPAEHDLDVAAVEQLWRRPPPGLRCHMAVNIRALLSKSSPDFDLSGVAADVAAAMLRIDSKQSEPLLAWLEAGERGFVSCLLNGEFAARALCSSIRGQDSGADITVPKVFVLPASYVRCEAYLRHAREGMADILSARFMPALLSPIDWSLMQESWRADPAIFLPLFESSDTASICFELVLHLDRFDSAASPSRINRFVARSEMLLAQLFNACAADNGFFCADLSVSKARLGLIFAVMHVSLVGLGIMHLTTEE